MQATLGFDLSVDSRLAQQLPRSRTLIGSYLVHTLLDLLCEMEVDNRYIVSWLNRKTIRALWLFTSLDVRGIRFNRNIKTCTGG